MTQHGWWQASDGNWYAPETHPDPAYRARFAGVAPMAVPPAAPPAVPPPLHVPPAVPAVDAPVVPNGMPSPDAATRPAGMPPAGFGPPTGPPAGFGPPAGPGGFGPPGGVQPLAPPTGAPRGGRGGAVVLVALLAALAVVVVIVVVAVALFRVNDADVSVAEADPPTSVERTSDRSAAPTDEQTGGLNDEQNDEENDETPPTADAAAVAGSRQQPLALGQTFTLRDQADGDIEVTVNTYTADANAAMAGANQFNQPAPAGSSYTLVNATFTYRAGSEKTSVNGITFALSLSAFGVSAVEIPSYSCVAVPPDAVNILAEVLDGGTVTGNTCFLMPSADAAGPLLLRVEESWCFEDCDEYWIKLQ